MLVIAFGSGTGIIKTDHFLFRFNTFISNERFSGGSAEQDLITVPAFFLNAVLLKISAGSEFWYSDVFKMAGNIGCCKLLAFLACFTTLKFITGKYVQILAKMCCSDVLAETQCHSVLSSYQLVVNS